MGDWDDRESNIENELLRKYLTKHGYTAGKINAAILKAETHYSGNGLYDNNEVACMLFCHGADVGTKAGEMIDKSRKIKAGMMQELLTGKKRLVPGGRAE
ncbi:hypothetical protein [Rhodopirellula europaea]|uniref:hypothetical protein n=1 Tax=Rhodopirellula europaea TaxID=1263866 RepID=UPI003D2A8BB1